jgi:hypothetical protein
MRIRARTTNHGCAEGQVPGPLECPRHSGHPRLGEIKRCWRMVQGSTAGSQCRSLSDGAADEENGGRGPSTRLSHTEPLALGITLPFRILANGQQHSV